MRLLRELTAVGLWALGFAFLGCFVGGVVFSVCEWVGVVSYEFHSESVAACLDSMAIGALAGGLLGFGWAVHRWYQHQHPVAGVEGEPFAGVEDEPW